MGKKGLGRKAFVKAAMAQPTEHSREDSAAEEAGTPAQPEVAPGAAELPAQSNAAPQQHSRDDVVAAELPAPDIPENETRGQMLQRHKREVKACKELAKKLGKKRKEEAAKLERDLEARHAQELAALQERPCEEEEPAAGAVSGVADSLHSFRLSQEGTKPTEQAGKPTRAQKRRDVRAAEEAEREARIKEEQASLGESDRAAEARALDALLDPLGLVVRDIPADGNCLYRAVEDQLLQCGAASEAAGGYAGLRARVAAHMREHAADYAPYIVPESQEGEQSDEAGGGAELFEEHCKAVEGTAAWGGQVELGVLAALLQRRITVYSVGMPAVHMGPDEAGSDAELRVCYLRHAYGLGEHYNSLEPRRAQEDGTTNGQ